MRAHNPLSLSIFVVLFTNLLAFRVGFVMFKFHSRVCTMYRRASRFSATGGYKSVGGHAYFLRCYARCRERGHRWCFHIAVGAFSLFSVKMPSKR